MNNNTLELVDINILNNIKKYMLSNTDRYDYRKITILQLYEYLQDNLKDNFFELLNKSFDNRLYYQKNNFYIDIDNIYEIHLKIINYLFNFLIYKKLNISDFTYKSFYDICDIMIPDTQFITFKFKIIDKEHNLYKLYYTTCFQCIKSDNLKKIDKLSQIELLSKYTETDLINIKKENDKYNTQRVYIKNNINIILKNLIKNYNVELCLTNMTDV